VETNYQQYAWYGVKWQPISIW